MTHSKLPDAFLRYWGPDIAMDSNANYFKTCSLSKPIIVNELLSICHVETNLIPEICSKLDLSQVQELTLININLYNDFLPLLLSPSLEKFTFLGCAAVDVDVPFEVLSRCPLASDVR